MKVMIACQCATNKGDRAIAEYLISQLTEIDDVQVVLSTTDPELWQSVVSNKVKVIGMGYRSISKSTQPKFVRKVCRAIDKFILEKIMFSSLISPKGNHLFCRIISKKFIKCVSEMDLVIVTGGHHITTIRERDALFSFTYDIGLIGLFSQKYVLWSQTIGPLDFVSQKAKLFFEKIIKNAEKVFLRDKNSFECIEKNYGHMPNLQKTYDSVFGFGMSDYLAYENRDKKIGVSIFHGLKKAFATSKVIAELLDSFVIEGYSVEFFRMEYDNSELDFINTTISLMKTNGDIKIFPFLSSTKEHLEEIASCSFFIGYKTHSVIMSLTTATPLLAIAYHEKTIDFMRDFGMEQFAISDEDTNLTEKAFNIIATLKRTAGEQNTVQKEISVRLAECVSQDFKGVIYELLQ